MPPKLNPPAPAVSVLSQDSINIQLKHIHWRETQFIVNCDSVTQCTLEREGRGGITLQLAINPPVSRCLSLCPSRAQNSVPQPIVLHIGTLALNLASFEQ